jgi:lysosomal Pro-X carboxypeptidase
MALRALAPPALLLLLLLPPPALAASARRPAPAPPAPLARLRAAQAARAQAAAGGGPVPCCPPFGPPAPPQFPSTYEARYFTQPVSHSNYLQPTDANNATSTFQQLFLYNDTFWAGPPAPIIFYTGAEGAGVEFIWPHSGWIVDTLARNLSALVVFAEHRFFGQSNPGGLPSGFYPDATHLGALSEAEVLEDYTALATSLRTNLSAWDSPLISVGGSLAGELTTWWRVRYPFIVDMGIASSAPILGYRGIADEFGWNRVVTQAFRSVGGDECVDNMRSGYWATSALSPAAATAAFNTCTPASLPCHAQQVADLMMSWAGGAAEGSYPPTANSSSVIGVCSAMQGSGGGVAAYQAALAPLLPGQCLNISWEWECPSDDHRPTKDDENDDSHFTPDPAYWGYCETHLASAQTCTDGWSFQACTTEIHPISANNVTDFFPPNTVDDRLNDCRFWYGGNLSLDFLAMPRAFGQLDLARFAQSTSRLIFSSGSYDPWFSQSINASLSATLPAVIIDQGAHHSDLGGPMNPVPNALTDTPSLVAARQFEIDTLHSWVAAFHEERRAAKAFMRRASEEAAIAAAARGD